MNLPTVILALFLSSISTTNATSVRDSTLAIAARHVSLAHRAVSPFEEVTPLEKRAAKPRKRCIKKSTASSASSTSKSSSASSSKKTTTTTTNNANSGVIEVTGSCGGPRATKQITSVSGPNGHIDWLNCGLTSGGWHPPYIRVQDLVTKSLSSALSSPSSPFRACASYIWIFEKYGNQYGIPPIMLASFAMQESSCNPDTVGGGGEQGLMQITRDKCGGAPDGNCKDPEFNIKTGARFFADTLKNNNGDVLLSIGQYNGWRRGLTYGQATAAAKSSCCRCQNNCDYLHQYVNGWIQNINAYDSRLRLGQYFNLDVCN